MPSLSRSQLDVLRFRHLGQCLFHSEGREAGAGVVGPAFGHELPHLSQTLQEIRN